MKPLINPRRRISNIRQRSSPSYYRGSEPRSGHSPFQRRSPIRKNHWLAKILDWTTLAVIMVILIYSLIVNPDPKVSANSLAYHSSSDYALAATEKLNSFGNRNKITLNEKSVVGTLMQRFPEISSANIELPVLSQKPVLRIRVSPPSLFLNNQGINYIVDADGKAVAKASAYPNIKNLPQVIDNSNFPASVGKQVLSSSSVNFMETVLAQSKQAGVTIKGLTLPQSVQEVDLTTSDQPYFVKFYLGGDALTQAGQFLAARHQFSSTHQQPSQYLDVRVSGKVFYK